MADILETIMIVMFGLSWPFNLVKLYKGRTAKGASLFFYIALELGYSAGIISKIIRGTITYVLIFYSINFILILACIIVYFRNKHLDKINNSIN